MLTLALTVLATSMAAKPPDKSLTVAVPGGGEVKNVTFGIRTFRHTFQLLGPHGGPGAGAEFTADLNLGTQPLLLDGKLYVASSFSSSDEPYATLKKEKLAAKAAADGLRVAYSVDGEKTWRVLLLNPPAVCRHATWPSAAAALAGIAEDTAVAFLRSAHPGEVEGLGEAASRYDNADLLEALAWAFAHLSPRIATAVCEWLLVPGNTDTLSSSDWRPSSLEFKLDEIAKLRAAAAANPALQAKLLAAAKAERPANPEDGPSLLQHAAGTAPSYTGRVEGPPSAALQVFAKKGRDWDTVPIAETTTSGGRFVLSGIGPGRYRVVFSAAGFTTWPVEQDFPAFNRMVTLRPAPR